MPYSPLLQTFQLRTCPSCLGVVGVRWSGGTINTVVFSFWYGGHASFHVTDDDANRRMHTVVTFSVQTEFR